jgi:hypothetical protein
VHEKIAILHKKVALNGLEYIFHFAVIEDKIEHFLIGPGINILDGFREVFDGNIPLEVEEDLIPVGVDFDLVTGFEDVEVLASD